MFYSNFLISTQYDISYRTARLVSTILFTDLVDLHKTISTLRTLIRKWVQEIRYRATATDTLNLNLDEASAIYSMVKDIGFQESTEENGREFSIISSTAV